MERRQRTVPITPESFNRIRRANSRYGATREALGVAKSIAEANPSDAHLAELEEAEHASGRALENFNRALGAAEVAQTGGGS